MHPLLLEKGYHVFPKVVPEELCQAVVRDIDEHTQNGEWGGNDFSGLVEMYHYQSMWNIRQHPEVHKCFAQIFGTDHLWVTIDRVCRKVPQTPDEKATGFMHWDLNPNIRPRVREVQGLIALTDTDESMGGFHCLPSLYKLLDEWIDSLPTKKAIYTSFGLYADGSHAYEFYPPKAGQVWMRWAEENEIDRPEYSWPIEKVPMKAGDLLIWDSYLPHGNGANKSDKTRYCQYISMIPPGSSRDLCERVACWYGNRPPSGLAFFGDPRCIEQQKEPARLTDLGEKLLGTAKWSYSTPDLVYDDAYACCAE